MTSHSLPLLDPIPSLTLTRHVTAQLNSRSGGSLVKSMRFESSHLFSLGRHNFSPWKRIIFLNDPQKTGKGRQEWSDRGHDREWQAALCCCQRQKVLTQTSCMVWGCLRLTLKKGVLLLLETNSSYHGNLDITITDKDALWDNTTKQLYTEIQWPYQKSWLTKYWGVCYIFRSLFVWQVEARMSNLFWLSKFISFSANLGGKKESSSERCLGDSAS